MKLGLQHSYATALEGAYLASAPTSFPKPELMTWNAELAAALGFQAEVKAGAAAWIAGGELPQDARPIAMAYAGHQFGGFSPQLGDGRALLIGEVIDPSGERWDVQLKGSGRTPFSRSGDGLATVGPILREALISDAMHRLGVPTTRVLGTARTGAQARRASGMLDGAVLARIGASHLRVGTFEFFAARRDWETVGRLVTYALWRHGPQSADEGATPIDNGQAALTLLHAVAERQAKLVAAWMSVGFIHGVMNTDNCTISGETIDYGPCAFMDAFDPETVFSSIDRHGRYAYGNQPAIAQWNLARLAEALFPLLGDSEDQSMSRATDALASFGTHYQRAHLRHMCRKLGLGEPTAADGALVESLLAAMAADGLDFTSTFRGLAAELRGAEAVLDLSALSEWQSGWRKRLGDADLLDVACQMDAVNPVYVPRNHLVEEALHAAIAGDMQPFERLHHILRDPFVKQANAERYEQPDPAHAASYVTFCGT